MNNFCFAQKVLLFDNKSNPTLDYNQIVNQLSHGQIIAFSNGVEFSIDAKLGFGDEFVVYSILNYPEYALRLIKNNQNRSEIKNYILAVNKAHELGLPTIEIVDYSETEWVLVRKIHHKMSLADFIRKMSYQNLEKINGESTLKIKQKLKLTFIQLGMMKFIDDLHEENLVYDLAEKKWLILDLKNQILTSSNLNDQTALIFMTHRYGHIINSQFYVNKLEFRWLADLLTGTIAEIQNIKRQQKSYFACNSILLN